MIPDESNNSSGRYLRRIREHPLDAVFHLAAEIGPRRATTIAEAQAAAYLDGRLRRSGLRVSVDPFRVFQSFGLEGGILGLCATASVVLYYWFPLPSLIFSTFCFLLACVGLRFGYVPFLARKRFSQNVIATRATRLPPRWRVVLLAPLDSPPAAGALVRLLAGGRRAWVGRVIACVLLLVCALLGIVALQRDLQDVYLWWYVQMLPAAYLLFQAVLDVWIYWSPTTPGAINHAGALAAVLASTEELAHLEHTELWVVMLGAASTAGGITDLLERYPFDPQQTLFIGVEGIGSGTLSYLTKQGLTLNADPLLLRLVAEVDIDDPLIDAEPCARARADALVTSLARAGFRTLSIICLDQEGQTPHYGSPYDTPDVVQPLILDRTIRLLTSLVRKIDLTPLPSQTADQA